MFVKILFVSVLLPLHTHPAPFLKESTASSVCWYSWLLSLVGRNVFGFSLVKSACMNTLQSTCVGSCWFLFCTVPWKLKDLGLLYSLCPIPLPPTATQVHTIWHLVTETGFWTQWCQIYSGKTSGNLVCFLLNLKCLWEMRVHAGLCQCADITSSKHQRVSHRYEMASKNPIWQEDAVKLEKMRT